ncbi:MAG: hypothetical protein ACT4OP_07185 [Actinomycetota bacterium]
MPYPFSSTAVLAAAILAIPLQAVAELTQSDLVLVRQEEVVEEDLYAAGNRIQVDGRIEGDLFAAAFDEILISGEVTGDVFVIAGRVVITGRVGGSVRLAATNLRMEGSVGDDVAFAVWEATVEGNVGRDLLVWGRRVLVNGETARDLRGQMKSLDLDGHIGGAVDVAVDHLRIGPTAEVVGEIAYRSSREAVVEQANPEESLVHRTPLRPNIRIRALRLLTLGLAWLLLLAGGLVFGRIRPERLERAVVAASRGWPTWLAGLGLLASPLVVLGLLSILLSLAPPAAGIPLALVFAPLIIGLIGVALLGAFFGVVPAAGAIGNLVIRNRSVPARLLVGMTILVVIGLIPILRWAAVAAIVPLGLGAWTGGGRRR